jgi:hypothetical protein
MILENRSAIPARNIAVKISAAITVNTIGAGITPSASNVAPITIMGSRIGHRLLAAENSG